MGICDPEQEETPPLPIAKADQASRGRGRFHDEGEYFQNG